MCFDEKTVTLKDGRTCVVRSASPEDAQAFLDNMKALSAESDFMLRYPDEVTMTLEEERSFLTSQEAGEKNLLLAAVVEDRVVGSIGLSADAGFDKFSFRGKVGLGVRKEFWGLGIGSALLEASLSAAKEMGFTLVELEVNKANERAVALYERFGFKIYGEIPHGSRLRDGTYFPEYNMVLSLEPCEAPRLAKFEAALAALVQRREENEKQLAKLKADGKEKTVRYREMLGQKLTDGYALEHFKRFGLL